MTAFGSGALCMFAIVVALMVFTAINPSRDQLRAATTYNAVAEYGLDGSSAESVNAGFLALENAVRERYGDGVSLAHGLLANDVAISWTPQGSDTTVRSTINYREFDLDSVDVSTANTLVAGRWPADTHEVAMSTASMEDLGVSVGDAVHLALSDHGLTVVGEFRTNLLHHAPTLIAPTGVWSEVGDGGRGGQSEAFPVAFLIADAEARAAFDSDHEGISNSDPLSTVPGFEGLEEYGITAIAYAANAPEFRPFWVRNISSFTLPAATVLGLVLVAQQGASARRDHAVLSSLRVMGFRRRQLHAASAWMMVTPILLGLLGGALLGLLIGIGTRPLSARAAGMDLSNSAIPWSAMLAGGALLAALAGVGAVGLSWTVTRRSATPPRAQGFTERGEPSDSHERAAGMAAAALVLAAFAATLVAPATTGRSLFVTGALVLALVLVTPRLLTLRMVSPRRVVPWLAQRLARAQLARVVSMAALVAIGLAAPLALLFLNHSFVSAAIASDRPHVPPGQVVVHVDASNPLTAEEVASLAAAAGTDAVPFSVPSGSVYLYDNSNPIEEIVPIGVVSSREQADVVLGWSMSEADWSVIEGGGALWIADSPPPSAPLQVISVDDATGAIADLPGTVAARAPSDVPGPSAYSWGPAVMLEEAATSLGVTVLPGGLRFVDAEARLGEIVEAAAAIGLPGDMIRAYEPSYDTSTPVSFVVALSALVVLVGIGVFVLARAGTRDARAFDLVLVRLGMPASTIRGIHLLMAALTVAVGAVVGLVAAVGISWADLSATNGMVPLQMPWSTAGLAVASILAVAGIGTALGAARKGG